MHKTVSETIHVDTKNGDFHYSIQKKLSGNRALAVLVFKKRRQPEQKIEGECRQRMSVRKCMAEGEAGLEEFS